MSSTTWLLSWDQLGLESCVNVSELHKKEVWNILSSDPDSVKSSELTKILFALNLRARANSHRFYEIYLIDVDSSIDELTFKKMFDDSPQAMADLIRERGTKLLCQRQNQELIKIK